MRDPEAVRQSAVGRRPSARYPSDRITRPTASLDLHRSARYGLALPASGLSPQEHGEVSRGRPIVRLGIPSETPGACEFLAATTGAHQKEVVQADGRGTHSAH